MSVSLIRNCSSDHDRSLQGKEERVLLVGSHMHLPKPSVNGIQIIRSMVRNYSCRAPAGKPSIVSKCRTPRISRILRVKLINDGMYHDGLLVDSEHRVCRYSDPIIYEPLVYVR